LQADKKPEMPTGTTSVAGAALFSSFLLTDFVRNKQITRRITFLGQPLPRRVLGLHPVITVAGIIQTKGNPVQCPE
jgi:hypothetical protein